MYSVRFQPRFQSDTDCEIVDGLSLVDALVLARNRAVAEHRSVDIYFDDQYHVTLGEGL